MVFEKANLSNGSIDEFDLARGGYRITVTGSSSRCGCVLIEGWIAGDFQRLCVFKNDTSSFFRLCVGHYRLGVSGANHVFVSIDRLLNR